MVADVNRGSVSRWHLTVVKWAGPSSGNELVSHKKADVLEELEVVYSLKTCESTNISSFNSIYSVELIITIIELDLGLDKL